MRLLEFYVIKMPLNILRDLHTMVNSGVKYAFLYHLDDMFKNKIMYHLDYL